MGGDMALLDLININYFLVLFSGFLFKKNKVTALYIAPVSKYLYPNFLATNLATVLLPAPEGPSRDIISYTFKSDTYNLYSKTLILIIYHK